MGPIPPHVIITSLLDKRCSNLSFIITFSSGTVNSEVSVNPLLYKICPKDERFVFTVSPRSISVPMLNNAIFTLFRIARLFTNKIMIIS